MRADPQREKYAAWLPVTDELPPQTRALLARVVALVEHGGAAQGIERADYRFSRRQIREHTQWGDTQLKVHLARLAELEYLLVHRGGRGQSFEYELLYDGAAQHSGPHVSGLIDVEILRRAYDVERSALDVARSGHGRGPVGTQSGSSRVPDSGVTPVKTRLPDEAAPARAKTHVTGNGAQPSYPVAAGV